MKQTAILISIFCLLSCNSKQTSFEKNDKVSKIQEPMFKEFMGKIPLRSLPLVFSCGLPDGPGSDNLLVSDYDKFKEFIPDEFDIIYGKIGQHNSHSIVIYGQSGDDIYPTLFTYSSNGSITDSLFLILNHCGAADEYQIPHSYVTIDRNLNITLIDTTKIIHYPSSQSDYVVDSLQISKAIYQIDENGKIKSR